MTAESDLVVVEKLDGKVALVTLNRPGKHNAINEPMHQAIAEALRQLELDDDVNAVVLTGAGDKAFSAGYDVREMEVLDEDQTMLSCIRREEWWWAIASFGKPLIAAVNGYALGGGGMLATCADIRVGCPEFHYRITAVPYYGVMASWNLPQIVGMGIAMEWLMTGRAVEADEALRTGLLNHVVPRDQVVPKAVEIASLIARNPAPASRALKRLVHANIGRSFADGFEAENAVMHGELKPKSTSELFAKFLAK